MRDAAQIKALLADKQRVYKPSNPIKIMRIHTIRNKVAKTLSALASMHADNDYGEKEVKKRKRKGHSMQVVLPDVANTS